MGSQLSSARNGLLSAALSLSTNHSPIAIRPFLCQFRAISFSFILTFLPPSQVSNDSWLPCFWKTVRHPDPTHTKRQSYQLQLQPVPLATSNETHTVDLPLGLSTQAAPKTITRQGIRSSRCHPRCCVHCIYFHSLHPPDCFHANPLNTSNPRFARPFSHSIQSFPQRPRSGA